MFLENAFCYLFQKMGGHAWAHYCYNLGRIHLRVCRRIRSIFMPHCLCAHAPHIQTTLYVRRMCTQTMPRTYRPLCMCGARAHRQYPAHTEWSVCAGHVHTDNTPHIQTTLYVRRTYRPHIRSICTHYICTAFTACIHSSYASHLPRVDPANLSLDYHILQAELYAVMTNSHEQTFSDRCV